MTALTLTEFLLARIAEDEAYARTNPVPQGGPVCEDCKDAATYGGFDPDRVLAECAAKRRVIAECQPIRLDDLDESASILADDVLRALALPYADHPDYREEWRA